jgi:hypothetical protein
LLVTKINLYFVLRLHSEELLGIELALLQEADYDLGLVGFDDAELQRLLEAQDAAEGLTDEDAVPELPEVPTNVLGDIWALGDHRVLCGDATVLPQVERLIAGEAVDLIFTDPPYNVDYEGYTEDRRRCLLHRFPGRSARVKSKELAICFWIGFHGEIKSHLQIMRPVK